MKTFTSLKTVTSSVPTVHSLNNGNTIRNPYNIANTFNNYFVSIGETTKKKLNIHINTFRTILRMKIMVKCFCNLLIKTK